MQARVLNLAFAQQANSASFLFMHFLRARRASVMFVSSSAASFARGLFFMTVVGAFSAFGVFGFVAPANALDTHVSSAQAAASPSTNAPLSFEAALARFHERADILRAQEADVARAEHASDAAKWLGGPKVDLSAMQIEGRKSLSLDLNVPLQGLSIPFSMSENLDIGGPRAAITATWPIYTGGAISAEQNALQGKAAEARAARDAVFTQEDAGLALVYWRTQLARAVLKLRRDALADEEESLRRARGFEKEGMLPKIERMAVEVSRDAAKRALSAAETDARVAETELSRALRDAESVELETPLFVLRGELGTLDAWKDRAQSTSPVLAQADALTMQADQGVVAAKSAYQPKVFAFGMKNLVKHYLTIPEPDWIAGIGVTFTLWDNRDRTASVAAAQSQRDKAGAARAEAKNDVLTAVEVAWLRTSEARDEYELTASTVALARENLAMREKSFAEGLSTALDVSTARTQLIGAEIARCAAAYKFVAGWASLHAAAGVMPDFVASLSRPDFEAVVPETSSKGSKAHH